MWFDRLTRDAGCAGIDHGAGSPPSAGSGQALTSSGQAPSAGSGQAPSAGSGQVPRGRRDVVRLGSPKTAGRLTMNGNGDGARRAGGGR